MTDQTPTAEEIEAAELEAELAQEALDRIQRHAEAVQAKLAALKKAEE